MYTSHLYSDVCCPQYNDLLRKKRIVENDKSKIAELIKELDQKKNEALEGAYERVNKVSARYFISHCWTCFWYHIRLIIVRGNCGPAL